MSPERSIIVCRAIRVVVVVLRLTCIVVVLVARRLGGHHLPTHARGHTVSVATLGLPFYELVRVPQAQGFAGIKLYLDETAGGCCVAGIAAVDGSNESRIEFLVVAVLDSVPQRFEVRLHHCLHELALVGVDG